MIDDVSETESESDRTVEWSILLAFSIFPQFTGEPLTRRSDDNAEALKKRLDTYHKQTKPLADYYAQHGLHYQVDAAKAASEVFANINSIFLKKRGERLASYYK